MRKIVGPGCDATAQNPLNQMMDQMMNDPSQMMGHPKGPMGPVLGPQGQMLGPAGGLNAAWNEAAMPQMGPGMPQQLRAHMAQGQQGPMMYPSFFELGMGPQPMEWAQEFAQNHPAQQMQRMPGPVAQENWAAQFQASSSISAPSAVAPMQSAGPPMMGPMLGPPMMGPMMMGPPMMGMSAPSMPFTETYSQKQHPPSPVTEQVAAPAVQDPLTAEIQGKNATPDTGDLEQARQMVEMLKNSGNPKFMNSTFVNFIDRVAKGDVTFQENKVIDSNGQELDWDALYDEDVAASSTKDGADLEKFWKESDLPQQGATQGPDNALPEDLMDDETFKMMEEIWNQQQRQGEFGTMPGFFGDQDYNDMFAGPDPFEDVDQMMQGRAHEEYTFQEGNPYLDMTDHMRIAQQLIAEGRDKEAIKAVEAEVQRNPESSDGWKLLGQLWAQMDQDIEAIQCLRRGHDVDPYNLDSLLALGVSLTNELDQNEALAYLREWLENHDDFQHLLQGLPVPVEDKMELRDQVTTLFNAASDIAPQSAEVFVALGVIENINRNYGAATQALAQACRLRPTDFACWNKLGATLANSGKSQEATIAYQQAVSLKPNYARAWANYAIAMSNLGNYESAARHYLSSLTINPGARHIWTFLKNVLLNANKAHLISFDGNGDLAKLKAEIPGSVELDDLQPTEQLNEPPDVILERMGL